MNTSPQIFVKKERLSRKKIIDLLLKAENNLKISEYPFLLIYTFTTLPTSYHAQMMVGVSRKAGANAVQRNRIKRQIRELYRCHKHQVYDKLTIHEKQAALAIIYTGNIGTSFSQLSHSFKKLIEKFIQNIA